MLASVAVSGLRHVLTGSHTAQRRDPWTVSQESHPTHQRHSLLGSEPFSGSHPFYRTVHSPPAAHEAVHNLAPLFFALSLSLSPLQPTDLLSLQCAKQILVSLHLLLSHVGSPSLSPSSLQMSPPQRERPHIAGSIPLPSLLDELPLLPQHSALPKHGV